MEEILRFIYIFIVIIYILQLSPILSKDVLVKMDNFYIKIILLLAILLLTYLQPSLGIISALAFLMTFLYMHNNLSVSLIMENSINEHFNDIKNNMQNENLNLLKEKSGNIPEDLYGTDINRNMNIRMNSEIDNINIWNNTGMINTDDTNTDCNKMQDNISKGSYDGILSTDNTFNKFMNLP
jgi:hypothetical protein